MFAPGPQPPCLPQLVIVGWRGLLDYELGLLRQRRLPVEVFFGGLG